MKQSNNLDMNHIKKSVQDTLLSSKAFIKTIQDIHNGAYDNEMKGKLVEKAIFDVLDNMDIFTEVIDISAQWKNKCGEDLLVKTFDDEFVVAIKSSKRFKATIPYKTDSRLLTDPNEITDRIIEMEQQAINNFKTTKGLFIHIVTTDDEYSINVETLSEKANTKITASAKVSMEIAVDKSKFTTAAFPLPSISELMQSYNLESIRALSKLTY